MQILITDVTEMGGGNFCVAGWHSQTQRMVRPLPSGGNWSTALIAAHNIRPGITISANPAGLANGAFPHRTEDTPINAATIQVVNVAAPDWLGAASPRRALTVDAAFNGNVVINSEWNGRLQGAHVPVGTQGRSLWGLEVSANAIAFIEDFGKLKAVVNDGHRNCIVLAARIYLT